LCQRVNQSEKTSNVDYPNEDTLMTIRPELLDELLKDYAKPEDLVGEGGLLKQLTKALVERCLDTEMELHLADSKYQTEGKAKRDRRNGHSKKTNPAGSKLQRRVWTNHP
jgi:transposase-like protein